MAKRGTIVIDGKEYPNTPEFRAYKEMLEEDTGEKYIPSKMESMMSVKEWITNEESKPVTEDLIQELLADGNEMMLLAGRTGMGKTNLVLHLAYCLATGIPFFGLECKKTTVGYLGFEGTPNKMADRLKKIAGNFPDPGDNLRFHMSPPLILEKKLDEFEALVKGCRVIILDPLRYLVGGNFCKPVVATAFLYLLRTELIKLRATAIICHHIKKPNQASLVEPGDLYEMKGATEYVDEAASVLMLERTRQGHKPGGGFAPVNNDNVTLYFAKHRNAVGELEPINLLFNREKLLFEKVALF